MPVNELSPERPASAVLALTDSCVDPLTQSDGKVFGNEDGERFRRIDNTVEMLESGSRFLLPKAAEPQSGASAGPELLNPLISKYEDDYKHALAVIETDVKMLVEQGREMAAMVLFYQQGTKIQEVHEGLSSLYSFIFNGHEVLKHFDSERLRQLGHTPKPITSLLNDKHEFGRHPEDFVINQLKSVGFQKKHWWLSQILLTEIEYMIESLKIMVEPNFIPFGAPDSLDERPDRYVPSVVKIAVWRRDGGKCVECGSKEKLEYDHMIPIAKGGSNTERNIQLLCEKCNRNKGQSIQ